MKNIFIISILLISSSLFAEESKSNKKDEPDFLSKIFMSQEELEGKKPEKVEPFLDSISKLFGGSEESKK